MTTDPLLDYRARLIERLATIPSEIADAIAAIPEARWHTPIRAGLRSPHALMARLRDMERYVYLTRFQRLLAGDETMFVPFDPPDWETEYYNPSEPMTQLLGDYAGLREAELQIIRSLKPADWSRAGRHAILGIRTMQWWVERTLEYSTERLKELRG